MGRDNNKKVLVTGADGGLGLPVVERLLLAGWQVTAFLHRQENIGKMKTALGKEKQENLSFIIGDITLAEDIERAAEKTKDLAALVHLAGGFAGAASFAETDVVLFDHLLDLNTRSTFLLLREILPLMKKNNYGSIVTIGAKAAIQPGKQNAVYAASKAALVNLTLSAAEEGRSYHVRANVIVPAIIRTEANMKWASSKDEIKKWTSPEDIAEVICWLISPESSQVTGTVIPMFNEISS